MSDLPGTTSNVQDKIKKIYKVSLNNIDVSFTVCKMIIMISCVVVALSRGSIFESFALLGIATLIIRSISEDYRRKKNDNLKTILEMVDMTIDDMNQQMDDLKEDVKKLDYRIRVNKRKSRTKNETSNSN